MTKKIVEKFIPIRDKILVQVDMSQKSDFEYKTPGGLLLWGNKDFGFDGKITQPVVATVIATGNKDIGLRKNDVVICHHNTFRREVSNGYMLGDTGLKTENRHSLFAIEPYNIQCKIDQDTGKPLPLAGFVLVERIPVKYKTQNIIAAPTDKYIPNQFRVLVSGGGKGEYEDVVLFPGDIIITYEKSDYGIEYTYKLKQHEAVRVKYSDILAISKQVYQ